MLHSFVFLLFYVCVRLADDTTGRTLKLLRHTTQVAGKLLITAMFAAKMRLFTHVALLLANQVGDQCIKYFHTGNRNIRRLTF